MPMTTFEPHRLRRADWTVLVALVVVRAPLGARLAVARWERQTPSDEAIPTSVAAVVSLIPEGLIVGEDPEIDAARFRRTPLGICLITQPMIDRLGQ